MSATLQAFDTNQVAATARLFSSAVIQELARRGVSPTFARLAHQSALTNLLDDQLVVGDLFDLALNVLKDKDRRSEYAYKAAITHKILLGTHSLRTASMLTEFRVGNSKADIVILNGSSSVYEIKSERDNLEKLTGQIESYKKVFARVNVIAGENHIENIIDLVSDDVGILFLNKNFQISTIRPAVSTPGRVRPECIYDAVAQAEAIEILRVYGLDYPRVPNTELYQAMRKVFLRLSPEEAHAGMVQVLKRTRSLLPLSGVVNELPRSLLTAALSTPLRKNDYARLLDAVRTPIKEALSWGND